MKKVILFAFIALLFSCTTLGTSSLPEPKGGDALLYIPALGKSGFDFTHYENTLSVLPFVFTVFADNTSIYISEITALEAAKENQAREELSSFTNYELWE